MRPHPTAGRRLRSQIEAHNSVFCAPGTGDWLHGSALRGQGVLELCMSTVLQDSVGSRPVAVFYAGLGIFRQHLPR